MKFWQASQSNKSHGFICKFSKTILPRSQGMRTWGRCRSCTETTLGCLLSLPLPLRRSCIVSKTTQSDCCRLASVHVMKPPSNNDCRFCKLVFLIGYADMLQRLPFVYAIFPSLFCPAAASNFSHERPVRMVDRVTGGFLDMTVSGRCELMPSMFLLCHTYTEIFFWPAVLV